MAGISASGAQSGPSARTPSRRHAAGIYGTIITAAVLAAAGDHLPALPLAVSILITLLVYWVAEEYAGLLGEQLEAGQVPAWADIRAGLAGTWPMVTASYIPLLSLVLARLLGASSPGCRQRRAGDRHPAPDDLRMVLRPSRPAARQAATCHHLDRCRPRTANNHPQGRGPHPLALRTDHEPLTCLAMYGQVSGPVPAFETARLVAGGSLYLTRTSLVHYVRNRKELLSRVNDLFGWVISGELTVHMSGQWPLADARSAHDELESRRSTGKLLLIP
jgi:hypothetical protein